MKKFKFPILLKVVLAGLLVSFVASGIAVIVSYNNQVNSYKKAMNNSIDNTLDDISYYYEIYESKGSTIADLQDIKDHVKSLYDERVENNTEKQLEDFDYSFEEFEAYYKAEDSWIYQRQGEMGLSQDILAFRIKYRELLNSLLDAQVSSGTLAAYAAYRDGNRLVFLGDSRMSKHQGDDAITFYQVPGSYYELGESDYSVGDKNSKYPQYFIYGRTTKFYTIHSEEDANVEIASIFIEYDEGIAVKEAQSVLKIELLIIGLTAAAIVFIYALLSYFMFVRNVNKLSKASADISQKLYNNSLTSPTEIKIHSNDEIMDLANSIDALQSAVFDYANIIEQEAAERQKINAELEVASRIQIESLPSDVYDDQHISLRSYIKAAKEVGGDFYDYFYLDESHFVVVIADVSGKGVPASLFMMKSKAILKGDIQLFDNLEEAIYHSNNRLVHNNKENLFVTAFIGIIDLDKKEMTFINAGHEKPYILSKGKVKKLEGTSNFVIGEIEEFEYKKEKVKFDEGDTLFMFTDGLNESINNKNEEFGYQRIVDNLTNNSDKDLDEIIKSMTKNQNEFIGDMEAFDDVTILAISAVKPSLSLEYKEKDYSVITDAADAFHKKFSYLPAKIKSEVGIIIDELTNNLISYEKREDLVINFEFSISKGKLTIRIISNGDDYNPFVNQNDKYLNDESDVKGVGGFGITIVKDLVDSYEYEYKNGQSIVTLIKKL